MTLTLARPRAITVRLLENDGDWWAVRDLLVRTHPITPVGWNWDVRHWDGSRFRSPTAEIARARQGPVALWEDGHRLVGVAHREGSRGSAFFELDPDYRHLEAEMLDWAEANLAPVVGGRRKLEVYAFDYDITWRALLEQRGYAMQESGGWTRFLRFGERPIPTDVVAAPYRLATTSTKTAQADAERMALLLNAAFGRTQHTAAEYLPFMAGSPSFSHDLNLVALAPDNSFAAHVGVNWDSINRFGIFEPVCTHPDHVRHGLARALMLEGMRRLLELGALSATVETGDMEPANALYRVCGFTEEYRGHDFERDLQARPPRGYNRAAMTSRFRGGEIYGITIPTVFDENNSIRCAGCGELIEGRPFRITILDIVSPEAPPSWAVGAALNPGPHQFHSEPGHFRAWARKRGFLFCRLSDVREIMRPVPIPGDAPRWGLCDGLHRQSHEFVPA